MKSERLSPSFWQVIQPRFCAGTDRSRANREDLRRPPGFSLVEIVVALGIVSVGLVGILGLLPAGLGVFRQSVNMTVQSQIAQQIINDAQLTPYDKLASSTTYYDESGCKLEKGGRQTTYTATVSLSNPTSSLASTLPQQVSTTLLVKISNNAMPQSPSLHSFLLVKNY